MYGLDLISRTDDQGEQEYYLYDGLGSVTDLTDDYGDVVDGYTYDVFGAIRSQAGSSPNEFTFTGEQVDATGLPTSPLRLHRLHRGPDLRVRVEAQAHPADELERLVRGERLHEGARPHVTVQAR